MAGFYRLDRNKRLEEFRNWRKVIIVAAAQFARRQSITSKSDKGKYEKDDWHFGNGPHGSAVGAAFCRMRQPGDPRLAHAAAGGADCARLGHRGDQTRLIRAGGG